MKIGGHGMKIGGHGMKIKGMRRVPVRDTDRRFIMLAVVGIIGCGVAVAGCGGSVTSSATASATASVTPTPTASSGVAEAAALAAVSEVSSTWTAPGPQIDLKSLSGKTVYMITNGANQFMETVGAGIVAAGQEAGVKVIPDYTVGTIAAADQGFAAAESLHASAIIVISFLTSSLSVPIKQATSSGIPVIQVGEHDPGPLTSPDKAADVYENVSPSYSEGGDLMADFVVADSQGHADVLVLNSPDVGDANVETAAFQAQMTKLCPSCKVKVSGVPEANRTLELPSTVSSAIVADPNLNYIVPVFDTMYPDFAAALAASGAGSRISIVGFDASSAEMALLQSGSGSWTVDGGYDDTWLGWAVMDETFRALLHKPALENENVPLEFFTKATVQSLDFTVGASPDAWFGNPAYKSGFLKLWSLSS
jgi:ribose transport system substrate-binding protein